VPLRAVNVLKAAFAEGRLEEDEFAERVSVALKSRTYFELQKITSDLPSGPLGPLGSPAVPASLNVASPFDQRAAIMSGGSVALAAFGAYFFLFWPILVAIILGGAASIRSIRYGPHWERTAIWSISGVMLAIVIWLILV
jgi:hypothetical protein